MHHRLWILRHQELGSCQKESTAFFRLQANLSMKESAESGIPNSMKTRAARIKYLRTQFGTTQAGFAKYLGVNRGAVGNWELGRDISRENLRKISELTGASIDWIEKNVGDVPTNIRRPLEISDSIELPSPNACSYTRDELIEAIRFGMSQLQIDCFSELDCLTFAETVVEALEAKTSGIPGMSRLDKARSRIEDAIEKFSLPKRRSDQADS